MIKQWYQEMMPPILQKQIRNIFLKKKGYFSGPYTTWSHALRETKGYQDEQILEKVKAATLQVRNNNHLFMRDGVIFREPQYSFAMLAALLKIAIENKGKLSVLDFGGALGTSYYQFKRFCDVNIDLQWNVVEQPSYTECGNKLFKNDELSFYSHLQDIPKTIDVILMSASLQYIEAPYSLLDNLSKLDIPYMIIDRLLLSKCEQNDKILVEHVCESIYQSSYPCWLLSYFILNPYLNKYYSPICEFTALEGKFLNNGFEIDSCGFFLRRNDT